MASAAVSLGFAGPAMAEGEQYGGEMIYAISADPESLFPGRSNNASSQDAWLYALEGLVELNEQNEVVPWLAESWTISEDKTSYTFKLREGVSFHDGTPFNAEAVAFVFGKAITEEYGYSKFLKSLESVTADSEYEVTFQFSEPSAAFLTNLTFRAMVIFSPTAFEENGEDWMASHPVGTGPFVFESFERGDRLRYVRNEDYWQEGKPYLDAVQLRVVPDPSVRVAMLEKGEVDRAPQINDFDLARLQDDPNIDVRIVPSTRQLYMSMDNTNKHLKSVDVRKALNHAVDKEGLIRVIYNDTGALLSRAPVLSETVLGFKDFTENGEASIFPYDPELAKELLKNAGYEDRDENGVVETADGDELVLNLLTRRGAAAGDFEVAQLTQTLLGEIGVKVELTVVETAAFWPAVNVGPEEVDHQLANLSWGVPTADPDEPMLLLTYSKSWRPICCNRLFYASDEVDRLTDLAHVEIDPAKRLEYIHAWQAELMNDAPMLFLPTLALNLGERSYLKGGRILGVDNYPARFAWFDKEQMEAQGIQR